MRGQPASPARLIHSNRGPNPGRTDSDIWNVGREIGAVNTRTVSWGPKKRTWSTGQSYYSMTVREAARPRELCPTAAGASAI